MLSEKTSMWNKYGKILQGKKNSWKQWCRKQSAARLIDVGKIVENNKKKIDRKWYLYWKQGEMKEKKSIVIFQVHPLIIFAVAQWLKIFFEGAIQKWYFCKAIQTEISTIETEFHISCDNYLPLCWLELIFNSNVPIEFRDLTCHLGCSQILHNFWSVLPVGSFLQLSVGNFQWN
jgi:hypothetical protein